MKIHSENLLSIINSLRSVSTDGMSTSNTCFERCRVAIEWQLAIYDHTKLLASKLNTLIKLLNESDKLLTNKFELNDAKQINNDAIGMAKDVGQILYSSKSLSENLSNELQRLTMLISNIEFITCELAKNNEQLESYEFIFKSMLEDTPQTSRE